MTHLPETSRAALDRPASRQLVGLLADHGYTARVAGGAVRDGLLGRAPSDIDLATDARPEEVMACAQAAGCKVVPTGLHHGTVTVVAQDIPIEVTTLRADVACDGRHAEVAFVRSFRDDAARRDLTFNAMFADLDGRVHDYFGGAEDLAARRVRFVGDPSARIQEDYLRILRFFRFRGRYGPGDGPGGGPAAGADDTLEAVAANAAGLSRISGERIWSETGKILTGPNPAGQLAAMRDTGVIAQIGLAHLDCPATLEAARHGAPAEAALAWGLGDEKAVIQLAGAWRLSKDERERARFVVARQADRNADLKRFRDLLTDGTRPDHLDALLRAAGRPDDARTLSHWTVPEFPVSGKDLLASGVPAGPELGARLRALKTRWQAADYRLTRDQLLAPGRDPDGIDR